MNWLKRKIRNWVNDYKNEAKASRANLVTADSESLSSEPLRLSIYRANGGTIVETRVYDRQKDRSQNQLHIVNNDQDLGEALSKIITMEALRG